MNLTTIMRSAVFLVLLLLVFSTPIFACSWDYSIWQVRSKSADPLYRFIQNGKAGYIDQKGKVVVKPTLEFYGNSGGEFFDGLLLEGVADGPYIDATGKKALNTKYYRNWDFSDGLAVAMKEDNNKWGYIDKTGKFVIEPQFEGYPRGYVFSFSEGMAAIRINDKYGYIDKTGKFVLQPEYALGKAFHDGIARIVATGPCVYFEKGPCGNLVTVGTKTAGEKVAGCKFSFIDKTGARITNEEFGDAQDFSEGLAAIYKNGKWGFIDTYGKMVIEPAFDEVAAFSDGMAAFRDKNQLWGFIDREGKVVIAPTYQSTEGFSDGIVVVGNEITLKDDEGEDVKRNEYFFINKKGERAFPERFLAASSFFKGLAHVWKWPTQTEIANPPLTKKRFAYINPAGKVVFSYTRKVDDDDED